MTRIAARYPAELQPGSFAARQLGCTCDPFANQFGKGVGEVLSAIRVFEIADDCPIHRPEDDRR